MLVYGPHRLKGMEPFPMDGMYLPVGEDWVKPCDRLTDKAVSYFRFRTLADCPAVADSIE